MAREQKATADLVVGDKVYTPTSRHARELTLIKPLPGDEGKVTLGFVGTQWTLPLTNGDGSPRMLDVEVDDLPRAGRSGTFSDSEEGWEEDDVSGDPDE